VPAGAFCDDVPDDGGLPAGAARAVSGPAGDFAVLPPEAVDDLGLPFAAAEGCLPPFGVADFGTPGEDGAVDWAEGAD
jgi:hypothetical protein